MPTEIKKSGLTTVKNIGIAVLTTVLGSTAVYFLGFQRNGNDEATQQKKNATAEAWSSVSDYIRYAAEKSKTIACFSCNTQEMKEEILRAFDQNVSSLRNLQKNQLVDEKMQTIIDRTIEQFVAQKPLYSMYYDSIKVIELMPADEKTTASLGLQQDFMRSRLRILTRDSSEIKSILSDINKKYDLHLSLSAAELKQELQYNALIRRWRIECESTIEFMDEEKTKFTTSDGVVSNGSWQRRANDIVVHFDDGDKLELEVVELSDKIFLFIEKTSGKLLGACPL